MSIESIVVMILVLTLNWGGFVFCLSRALRSEKNKV
ncbi:MAG: MetS family NSS transporter small subunit [Bacteroidetes bacterium]|nr:MetS family NSS transporter small subunit [Bacteroidota bacterium]